MPIPHSPNPTSTNPFSGRGKRGVPMLWQIIDHRREPIFPHLLAMHVNPSSFDESFTKSKNVVPTYGGFVEFIWQDELTTISSTANTGAFINPNVGLTSGSDMEKNVIPFQDASNVGKVGRQSTIAFERQEDLLDIFHNNGMIYDGLGVPRIRGRIRCIYDRGIFTGHFENFDIVETDEKSFSFDLSWTFRVEEVEYSFADSPII